jgi:hypothetical protein
VLQVLEQTGKTGRLNISSSSGQGWITFAKGLLLDATFRDNTGEDALVELFGLHEGTFRYQPQQVEDGPINRPIGFMMMEVARLSDELSALKDFIPEDSATLSIKDNAPTFDEPEVEVVKEKLVGGPVGFDDLLQCTGLSKTRLRLALARLNKAGCLVVSEKKVPVFERPLKVLFLCDQQGPINEFKAALAETYGAKTLQKKAMVDILPIKTEFGPMDFIFFERAGQFVPVWEGFLADADLVVCLLEEDKEPSWVFSIKEKRPQRYYRLLYKDIQSAESVRDIIEQIAKAATL